MLCGIVNYLVADLSERLGMYTLYIQSYGFLLLWAGYYTYSYVHWLTTKTKDDTHFFTKAKSEYYINVTDSPDSIP